MFDMGFLPSIRKIAAALPPKRQTMLFSATMPSEIRALAREFQRDPVRVEISITKPLETVSHFVYPVAQGDKYEMLRLLLPQTEGGQALIFTRTKHRAKKLALQLSNGGHNATSLQGNLSQGQREKAMESFRSGRVKVMVATDIAARGIDISLISHVINFDIPDTAEAYTHSHRPHGAHAPQGNRPHLRHAGRRCHAQDHRKGHRFADRPPVDRGFHAFHPS